MKKILFVTEFSTHAPKVYEYALQLANKFGASILFGQGYGRPKSMMETRSQKEQEKDMLAKLEKFATENTPESFKHIKLEFAAELDFPAEAIMDISKKHEADIIVISMTGKSDKLDLHFSDTTLKLMREAIVPVLAIPAAAKFDGLKKMVFSTAFHFNDLLALNTLYRWSQKFDSSISTVHVMGREQERKQDLENLEALRTAYQMHENMDFKLLPGKQVRQLLLDYVSSAEASLLAMSTHQRSRFSTLLEGSTTSSVARKIQVPLLVVKKEDDIKGQ